jgi:hypothetical protein
MAIKFRENCQSASAEGGSFQEIYWSTELLNPIFNMYWSRRTTKTLCKLHVAKPWSMQLFKLSTNPACSELVYIQDQWTSQMPCIQQENYCSMQAYLCQYTYQLHLPHLLKSSPLPMRPLWNFMTQGTSCRRWSDRMWPWRKEQIITSSGVSLNLLPAIVNDTAGILCTVLQSTNDAPLGLGRWSQRCTHWYIRKHRSMSMAQQPTDLSTIMWHPPKARERCKVWTAT